MCSLQVVMCAGASFCCSWSQQGTQEGGVFFLNVSVQPTHWRRSLACAICWCALRRCCAVACTVCHSPPCSADHLGPIDGEGGTKRHLQLMHVSHIGCCGLMWDHVQQGQSSSCRRRALCAFCVSVRFSRSAGGAAMPRCCNSRPTVGCSGQCPLSCCQSQLQAP